MTRIPLQAPAPSSALAAPEEQVQWGELFEVVYAAVRHGDAPMTGEKALAAIHAEFVVRGLRESAPDAPQARPVPTPDFPPKDDLESRLRFKAWQIQHDRPDTLGQTLSLLLLEAADALRAALSGTPQTEDTP